MYEDCACGKPCGMEPMGCTNCAEIFGPSYVYEEELYDYYDRDYDWEDD